MTTKEGGSINTARCMDHEPNCKAITDSQCCFTRTLKGKGRLD